MYQCAGLTGRILSAMDPGEKLSIDMGILDTTNVQ